MKDCWLLGKNIIRGLSIVQFTYINEWRLFDDNWGSHQSENRREPDQATYPLFLVILAGIIHVDLWEFLLHQVFTLPQCQETFYN